MLLNVAIYDIDYGVDSALASYSFYIICYPCKGCFFKPDRT